MKKILLIGKLSNIIQTFNESLSERFHVQICPNSVNVVKDMIRTLRPCMVVLCVAGWDEADTGVFDLFCDSYSNTPVLLVGTDNSRRQFWRYYENERFQYIESPVTKKQLLDRCFEMMNPANPESEEKVASREEQGTKTLPDKKRILVVDDNPILLRSVKVMLDEIYMISVATSGEQALKMIGKKRPDLILLDYEMPEWDGKKTLEMIRKNPDTSDIPVIFLTGMADKGHVMEILALKPEGYILKPPSKEKMTKVIQETLKLS